MLLLLLLQSQSLQASHDLAILVLQEGKLQVILGFKGCQAVDSRCV